MLEEVLTTSDYYKRASNLLKRKEVERALTVFLQGVDKGFAKCAYGIVQAVTTQGSPTFTQEEAISIFNESYEKIKALASQGDTEAMVMVAEGIRYAFVDDEDEPYLFWLNKAKEMGNKDAEFILEEIDKLYEPITITITDDFGNSTTAELSPDETADVLHAEPDNILLEDYGIADILREEKRRAQILMSDPNYDPEKPIGANRKLLKY